MTSPGLLATILLFIAVLHPAIIEACNHDASVCVPPFGHRVEFNANCVGNNKPDGGLGCNALGYECCRFCGFEYFANCTEEVVSDHEFYIELVQGDSGSGSHCAQNGLTNLIEEKVVYHAQTFFGASDIALEGGLGVTTEDSTPGEEVVLDDGGTQAVYVTRFVLIDTISNTPIQTINEGDTFYLDDLPSGLTIEAETVPPEVGSLQFDLNGQPHRTESFAPYTINGDTSGNYFASNDLDAGLKVLKATPFSGSYATGTEYPFLSVSFTIESGSQSRNLRKGRTKKNAPGQGGVTPQQHHGRSLYSSYWYSKSSFSGRMRCSYCSFANHDANHGRRRKLSNNGNQNIHSEYEAYMSHHLTRDVRNHLTESGITCLGKVGEIDVYFAQAS